MLEPVQLLAAMITPAVLISAAALLLLSTAARLGRVNDRVQAMIADVHLHSNGAERSAAVNQQRLAVSRQLRELVERLVLLRSAVTAIYVTMALLVATSIAAGMYVVFPAFFRLLSVSTGLLGAVAFLYSIVVLIREASIAVHGTRQEIAELQRLIER
jgi:hypothetical protein